MLLYLSYASSLRIRDFYNFESLNIETLLENGKLEMELEGSIYFDTLFGCIAMHNSDRSIPDDALEFLTRSSDRGCPVAQLYLSKYLMRTNPQDEAAMEQLQLAATSGLCEAHLELGIVLFSKR
jgi:hypothetical protein